MMRAALRDCWGTRLLLRRPTGCNPGHHAVMLRMGGGVREAIGQVRRITGAGLAVVCGGGTAEKLRQHPAQVTCGLADGSWGKTRQMGLKAVLRAVAAGAATGL